MFKGIQEIETVAGAERKPGESVFKNVDAAWPNTAVLEMSGWKDRAEYKAAFSETGNAEGQGMLAWAVVPITGTDKETNAAAVAKLAMSLAVVLDTPVQIARAVDNEILVRVRHVINSPEAQGAFNSIHKEVITIANHQEREVSSWWNSREEAITSAITNAACTLCDVEYTFDPEEDPARDSDQLDLQAEAAETPISTTRTE